MSNVTSHLPNRLSRRAAIRAAVLGATALFAARPARRIQAQDGGPYDPGGRVHVEYDETTSFNELFGNPPLLGRSESWNLRVLNAAENGSDQVRRVKYDEVLPIYQALHGVPPVALKHNDIWYDVGDGYIHSSYVVPVHEVFNEPVTDIGSGFWGEITVPTSWQHWEPKLRSRRWYDLAYGTVYKVADVAYEEDGRAWYRIINDLTPRDTWWVQATHIRRIAESEFAPISPEVASQDKFVRIDIGDQLLNCYEKGVVVFSARIASGAAFFDDEGQSHQYNTPYGEHTVMRKTPSRHMVGGQLVDDFYDLPGVPWCTYFTDTGAAIHGTYWHNDFGHPRSHGCVNVTSDAAKWIYRWVNPYTGYGEDQYVATEADDPSATVIRVER